MRIPLFYSKNLLTFNVQHDMLAAYITFINFMSGRNNKNHPKRVRRIVMFLEFFVVGVVFGISEDLIAIFFATGEGISPKIFLVATLVSIPFAAFSELVVDSARFREKISRAISLFIPDGIEEKLKK